VRKAAKQLATDIVCNVNIHKICFAQLINQHIDFKRTMFAPSFIRVVVYRGSNVHLREKKKMKRRIFISAISQINLCLIYLLKTVWSLRAKKKGDERINPN